MNTIRASVSAMTNNRLQYMIKLCTEELVKRATEVQTQNPNQKREK